MFLLVVGGVGSSPALVAISFVLLILLTIFKVFYNRVLETDQRSVQGGNKMNIAKAYFKDILIALCELLIDKAIEISHSIRIGSLAKAYRINLIFCAKIVGNYKGMPLGEELEGMGKKLLSPASFVLSCLSNVSC